MRFLLYNIRYGVGIGKRFHLPFPYSGYLKRTHKNLVKITDFIKSMKPDVVGLIEVDCGSYRSGRLNQAEEIAESLGHYHVYESKYDAASMIRKIPLFNKQGNAFLTGQKIKAKKFHYFRKGVKRLVIELELEKIRIFLVHLSLKFRHRQYQLNDLRGLVKSSRKPVILAGDFNVFRGGRELDLFLDATGLKSADLKKRASHPTRFPRRQLDFIFYGPGIHVKKLSVPRVKLSDHLPLICDFEILKTRV